MSNPLVIKPYDISQKFTHRQLYEDSPSSRDGMSLDQQHYCRRMYVGLIQDAGMQLRLPQGTISTAIMFCHRYYAVKSMVKNDRFIMATASLFLAGKADETPKALRDVMKACFEVRYSRRPKELEKLADAGVMDLLRERIVVGERALVYAINFDFNVRHPYKVAMQVIDHFKLHILPDLPPDVKLQQVVWNMINDSYRSLLALEYTAEDLGVALTFFALQLLRVRPPLIGNMQWWDTLGVSANTIGEIGDAMVDLYQNSQKLMEQVAAGRQPGPVSSPAPHSNDALPASSARQLSDSRPSEESEQAAFRLGVTPGKRPSSGTGPHSGSTDAAVPPPPPAGDPPQKPAVPNPPSNGALATDPSSESPPSKRHKKTPSVLVSA